MDADDEESLVEIYEDVDGEYEYDDDDDGGGGHIYEDEDSCRDVVGPARNIAVLTDEEREYIIDMIFNRGVPVSRLSQEIGCTKEAVYGVTRAFRAYNRHRTFPGQAKASTITAAASRAEGISAAGSSKSETTPSTASNEMQRSMTTTTTKKGNNPIVSKMYNQQEEEILLRKFIRTNNCTSVKELQDYINGQSDTFPGIRSLSKRTLYRILKRCRADGSPEQRSLPKSTNARVLHERLKYIEDMSRLEKLNASRIIFVDICGYELTLDDNASVAESITISTKCDIDELNSRGGVISVCLALSESGIVHASFKLRPYTTENFLGFLRELAKKLPHGKHVFVLDPVPSNKVLAVQNYFKVSGNVVKYLPKFSHFLNPLNEAFATLKARACENATLNRPQSAVAALAAARHSITGDLALSWITNTRMFYDKCLRNAAIVQTDL